MAFSDALAVQAGPYDEASVLPEGLDIQLTLSRNDRPQPFHLICEYDSVIVCMSGGGRVEFEGVSVRHHDYVLGDVIYVPAGTPHRIVPSEESIHHRFKLPESRLEGVAWYCPACGQQIHRVVWSLTDTLAQEGYLSACQGFNADQAHRRCEHRDAEHPPIDLEGYRWEQLSTGLRSGGA